MDVLGVDPHLDPDPGSLQLHLVRVGGPLDSTDPPNRLETRLSAQIRTIRTPA
jgi:hypothetical protein